MRHDHLISAKQLSRGDIEAVLDRAAEFAADSGAVSEVGADELLGLCFFEPSTRTKMSFDAAMKRLGGDTVDMGSVESSSVKKGESLADTARVIEGYADALVLRHPAEGSARLASEFVDVPVINAGDGAGQHPTQTLLDLYTIRESAGFEDLLDVGVLADPCTLLVEVVPDALRQLEALGADEVLTGADVRQGVGQRVDRPAVL